MKDCELVAQVLTLSLFVNVAYGLHHRCAVAEMPASEAPLLDQPTVIWYFALISMNKRGVLVNRAELGAHKSGDFIRPFYRMDGLSFLDCRVVELRPDSQLVLLRDLILVPGGLIAPTPPVAFEIACVGLNMRRPGLPRAGIRSSRKATGDARQRLREEYPWLTDADVGVSLDSPAPNVESEAIARHAQGRKPERLSDFELSEAAFADVQERLQQVREKWQTEAEEADVNFYHWIPGGMWTQTFRATPADSAVFKARSHTKFWRDRFGWPGSKTFMFSAHSEMGAVLLAKEWARKSDHLYSHWIDSEGLLLEYSQDEHAFEFSVAFLDWVSSLDVDCDSFQRVHELFNVWPR